MLRNNEDFRLVQQGKPKLPVHACLGMGRCPWYADPVTCVMCRELHDVDDVGPFVDRLLAGH